jgi:hypothetical protein
VDHDTVYLLGEVLVVSILFWFRVAMSVSLFFVAMISSFLFLVVAMALLLVVAVVSARSV